MELLYGKKELEQIAKLYDIKGAYKLKKAELIEVLKEEIPKKMPEMLFMLDEKDLILFEDLIERDKEIEEGEVLDQYYHLMELEWVQFIKDKKGDKLCVAPIIKDTYLQMDKSTLLPQVKRQSQLREYIISILNLYGVVKIDWAVTLFNKYYEPSVTADEIIALVKKDMRLACQSKIMDNYIVEETIYAIDKSNFKDFIAATIDKDYFVPTKELLEKVNDETYYEDNLNIQRLKSYLAKRYGKSSEEIEEIIIAIHMIARVDCDRTGKTLEIIIEEIANLGIEFKSLTDINEMVKYVMAVVGHIRKWVNKGFTAAELLPHIAGDKPAQKIKVVDIGRNAPCPCGSGKKYKKCCGR